MQRLLALIGISTMLALGVTQQHSNNAPKQAPAQQEPAAQAKPQTPKTGTLTAAGKPLNFFSRGEGTLTVRGRGYLVVNTVQGNLQIEGFREVKELPRNVRIKPPLDQRLKVYMGQGTLRVQGKYDSVRAVLREGRIEFKGVAAFNLSGVGDAYLDGVRRELTPTSTFTLLVPEPQWTTDDVQIKTPKPDER
ncbi:MAG: hypothetical protein ACK4P5_04560 [Fimbriimonadales bacterium]